MPRIRTVALPVALAAALLIVAPTASAASRAPCVLGTKKPKCHIWYGKVKAVDDGDTVNVKFDGTRTLAKIRMIGIQAMELHKYGKRAGRAGECTAVEAAEYLERIIRRGHSRARIAAVHPGSVTGKRRRLRRSIAVKINGRWVDAGAEVLRAGYALWFPNHAEWAWNRKYARLAAVAARKQVGVWNPTACGRQVTSLALKAKWNANGNDSKNINGEWIRVTNMDPLNPVSLGGWWLRDSHLRPRYTFPRSAALLPGQSLRVFAGRGRTAGDRYYWGLRETIFENVVGGRRYMGDGAYLFDPHGDLQTYTQYPCQLSCRDPLAGDVEIRVVRRGGEKVTLINRSSRTLNLAQYEIENSPWFYEFNFGTVLLPGQRLVLFVRKSRTVRNAVVRSWGRRNFILNDRKDAVTLRNPLGAPVTCQSWGRTTCPHV